jgi:Ser/Thr protein kinase RdoA (MazF antagonist)
MKAADAEFAGLADVVASSFDLGEALGPMALTARGEQGVVWRIETTTGPYAVKELVMRRSEDEVALEVTFQERAAETGASYDVARTVRCSDGRVLTELAGRQVRVQSWLDMTGPDPSVDPAPAERLEVAIPELLSFEELLVEPVNPRTCHRDLWADNVRMTRSGRLCVFDWDNCGPASADHELAMVLWEFGLDDPDRLARLRAAYVDGGGPARVRTPGDFTMLIAQFGHFHELAIAPFLDPNGTEEDREHGLARFAEFDSRPLTHASIALVIDTCRDD